MLGGVTFGRSLNRNSPWTGLTLGKVMLYPCFLYLSPLNVKGYQTDFEHGAKEALKGFIDYCIQLVKSVPHHGAPCLVSQH